MRETGSCQAPRFAFSAAENLCIRRAAGASRFPGMKGWGSQGKNDNNGDDPVNLLVNVWNCAAEKVTGKNHSPDPQEPAENIVSQIVRVRHPGRAGYWRAERSDDGNETRHDDGLAAVLFIESMRAFEMALLEEPRILALIQALSHLAADKVA